MRKPKSKLGRIVVDIVAPLILYSRQVRRVHVPDVNAELQLDIERRRSLERKLVVRGLSRRQRRAYESLMRNGVGEERAFSVVLRMGRSS